MFVDPDEGVRAQSSCFHRRGAERRSYRLNRGFSAPDQTDRAIIRREDLSLLAAATAIRFNRWQALPDYCDRISDCECALQATPAESRVIPPHLSRAMREALIEKP